MLRGRQDTPLFTLLTLATADCWFNDSLPSDLSTDKPFSMIFPLHQQLNTLSLSKNMCIMYRCRQSNIIGSYPKKRKKLSIWGFRSEILKLLRRGICLKNSDKFQDNLKVTYGYIFQPFPAFANSASHDHPLIWIFMFLDTCCFPRADVWITAPTVCAVIPPSLTQQSCYLFSAWVSKCSAKAKTERVMTVCQAFLCKPKFSYLNPYSNLFMD